MLLDPVPAPDDSILDGIDLDEIEQALVKANQGNWFSWRNHDGTSNIIWSKVGSVVGEDALASDIPDADADYIMAVQPRVMKKILRRLREAEGNFGEFIERAQADVKYWFDHCREMEKKYQDVRYEQFGSTKKIYDMMFDATERANDLTKENEILKAQGAELPEDDVTVTLIAEVFKRRRAWNILSTHIEMLKLTDEQACARAECTVEELTSWRAGESLPSSAQAGIIGQRCSMDELMDRMEDEDGDV